jgi:prepilin-type processing-associated H-X9-DG protein
MKICFSRKGWDAFSRTELIVVIGVTAILGVLLMPFAARFRGNASTAHCAANLRQIGIAMSAYTQDSQTKLPYAYLHYNNQKQISWDRLLDDYLPGYAAPKPHDPQPAQFQPPAPVMLCPQDTLPPASWAQKARLHRRSYSISRHDMLATNWPPSFDNNTGVGLWWTFGATGEKPPPPRIYDTNDLAAVMLEMILSPKTTLFVTEQINPHNISRNGSRSFIFRTLDHMEGTNGISPDFFHQGKFNYLMIDGHAETLLPQETVGPSGEAGKYVSAHKGIWTINNVD